MPWSRRCHFFVYFRTDSAWSTVSKRALATGSPSHFCNFCFTFEKFPSSTRNLGGLGPAVLGRRRCNGPSCQNWKPRFKNEMPSLSDFARADVFKAETTRPGLAHRSQERHSDANDSLEGFPPNLRVVSSGGLESSCPPGTLGRRFICLRRDRAPGRNSAVSRTM